MADTPHTPLLDTIHDPADLRGLSVEELSQVAGELRAELLHVVSQIGGHLASSLGVAELTVALHARFDTPNDLIVWDVGHQTYGHKILTGRRAEMMTLRKTGGISGFARRSESAYDTFGAGHASTSISAALGMAVARDLRGGEERVIAVIGDGGLTGGMAFEALNNAGNMDTNLIVVLNDNEMSISRNVGALSLYLSRLITNPRYNVLKRDIEALMKAIPGVGESIFQTARRVQNSAGALLKPGHLFEELGFKYVGPIDGHSMPILMETLASVATLDGPVLLHILTKKGKGYEPAEADPVRYHGVTPFKLEPEKLEPADAKAEAQAATQPVPPKYTDVFGDTLVAAGGADDRIVTITAAMPGGTGVMKFAKAFPERCFDVGIAEQHAVTFAAGLATQGMIPVCAIYSTFLQRAYDQLIHDVCLQNLPVRFVMDRSGLVGADGPTHHGVFDVAYLRAVPNIVAMAPKDEEELRAMTRWMLRYDEHPTAIRYPRGTGIGVPLTDALPDFEVGKAEVLQEGDGIVIFALGSMVHPALAAAAALAKEDISAAVINLRFYKPLDATCIREWAERCRNVVTVEEAQLNGGVGEGIVRILAEAGTLAGLRVKHLGVPDNFQVHAAPADLLGPLGLTAEGIAAAARTVITADTFTGPSGQPLHATLS